MATRPVTLIYCAGRGGRFAEIAIAAGFAYGCRSDYRPSHPVAFADLDWHAPNLEQHATFVREHAPRFAVAPDVLALGDLPATLRYAERLAEHAARVLIVPKVAGVMAALPREPWLMIGYSVPSRYGGADALLLSELAGWDVHLLGGTPAQQLTLAPYLDVVSADGSAATKAARWGTWFCSRRRKWIGGAEGLPAGPGLPYRTFERSCGEIVRAWDAALWRRVVEG